MHIYVKIMLEDYTLHLYTGIYLHI